MKENPDLNRLHETLRNLRTGSAALTAPARRAMNEASFAWQQRSRKETQKLLKQVHRLDAVVFDPIQRFLDQWHRYLEQRRKLAQDKASLVSQSRKLRRNLNERTIRCNGKKCRLASLYDVPEGTLIVPYGRKVWHGEHTIWLPNQTTATMSSKWKRAEPWFMEDEMWEHRIRCQCQTEPVLIVASEPADADA